MTTTEAKAKEVRPLVEKMITKARIGNLAARRLLLQKLGGDTEVVMKLISDIAPKYAERKGGYTRIVKLPKRGASGAKMAVIEMV